MKTAMIKISFAFPSVEKADSPIYMQILSLKFSHCYYTLNEQGRGIMIKGLNRVIDRIGKEAVSLRMYRSIRHDSDLIVWLSANRPELISDLNTGLRTTSEGCLETIDGFLSIYDESPYIGKGSTLESTLSGEPGHFLVAYPMSKSNDWYQISYDERKRIMAEHIGMALSHPDNHGIRSYTTYSFGISDSEFVVIYEVENLVSWSNVTKKLREATARKWITSETPVLVGSHINKIELQ